MHDPDVVVFDVHVPVPHLERPFRNDSPRWGARARRFISPASHAGQRIYPWFRPKAYEVFVADKQVRWRQLCTVWHNEPEGRDSGSTCKGMKGSDFNWHNVRWAFRHRKHLSIHFGFSRRVKRWLHDRCESCGKRFRWKGDARCGYMSSDKVWHDACMSLMHVRSQLDDAYKVFVGIADDNERWRVETWVKERASRDDHVESIPRLPKSLPDIERTLRDDHDTA